MKIEDEFNTSWVITRKGKLKREDPWCFDTIIGEYTTKESVIREFLWLKKSNNKEGWVKSNKYYIKKIKEINL